MIKAWSKKLEQGRELQLASVCRESGTPYQGQASSNQGQASSDQGQASSDQGQASTNQGQISTSQGPASNTYKAVRSRSEDNMYLF